MKKKERFGWLCKIRLEFSRESVAMDPLEKQVLKTDTPEVLEAEAEESGVEGHTWLKSKFESRTGCMRLCLQSQVSVEI